MCHYKSPATSKHCNIQAMLQNFPHEILHKVIEFGKEPVLNRLLSVSNKQLVAKCVHPHVSGMLIRNKVKRRYLSFLCKNGYTQIIKWVIVNSKSTLAITPRHLQLTISNGRLGTARYLLSARPNCFEKSTLPQIICENRFNPQLWKIVSVMLNVGLSISSILFDDYRSNLRDYFAHHQREESKGVNWLLPIVIAWSDVRALHYYVVNYGQFIPLKETLELCAIHNNKIVQDIIMFHFRNASLDFYTFDNIIRVGHTITVHFGEMCSFALSSGVINHQTLVDLCIKHDGCHYLQELVKILAFVPFNVQHLDYSIICRAWKCADYINSYGINASGKYLPLNWKFKDEHPICIARYLALGLPWTDVTELLQFALLPSNDIVLSQILKHSLYSKLALEYYSSVPWMRDIVHNLLFKKL